MGTSTRNKGQNGHNPLLPTWLDGDGDNTTNPESTGDATNNPDISVQLPIPPEADPNRFRGPRTSFTHFVAGNGTNHSSMRRGISNYISRSLGGSANATKRLGSSRRSTAALYGILNSIGSGGFRDAARLLSLESLEGLRTSEFFIRIAEFICPDGGPNDEGISRSAYYDTVVDNPDIMNKPVESLNQEEINAILKKYMAKVVMQQIMNGIANNAIRVSKTLDEISHVEDAVEQFIEQSISDAIAQVKSENANLTNKKAQEITDDIYHRTFEILEEAGY